MRAALFALAVSAASPAVAHFLEILPAADVLDAGGPVRLEVRLTHPFEGGPMMDMAPPARVGVLAGGALRDLQGALEPAPEGGAMGWAVNAQVDAPGGQVFFVVQEPYWEPGEGKYIIHQAKVVVDGWASGEGWDAVVGLPVEIVPLTRPSGLWTGNLFTGQVLAGGTPLPHAEVEVEWVNDGSVSAPNPAFVTQVLHADANGTFSYAMPRAGWWGFAALTEAGATMTGPDGTQVPVELGGLIWVRATDMGSE